ncbi:hypothetical protein K491DRAFT_680809 [Lophiostoma macrostomum CBS 122681]|uniref:Nudix hydrolase domain-containing protein n=1 Tax=Lophiostoma macrostomum CBS 122681 TaxID=1314788 RepID=A0A6A6T2R6_9PLEO|nr:hypothetical protein K491DRAFT_680809 [Lophiostoma macrostomum CBS 122681]
MSTTFECKLFGDSVKVKGLTTITGEHLEAWGPFQTWAKALKKALELKNDKRNNHILTKDFTLNGIEIQSVNLFGPKIGFVKLEANITRTDDGSKLPGIAFLRGGSVAILMILYHSKEEETKAHEAAKALEKTKALEQTKADSETKNQGIARLNKEITCLNESVEPQVVFVVQPRVAIGSLAFQEIPAGMLDVNHTFAGQAAKEINEEVGITSNKDDLKDMTALAAKKSSNRWWSKATTVSKNLEDEELQADETLQAANYPSVGGCDEAITLYLYQTRVSKEDMESLKSKATGVPAEVEHITTKLVPLKNVWTEGARDGKTLAALALYQNLKNAAALGDKEAEEVVKLDDKVVKLDPSKPAKK